MKNYFDLRDVVVNIKMVQDSDTEVHYVDDSGYYISDTIALEDSRYFYVPVTGVELFCLMDRYKRVVKCVVPTSDTVIDTNENGDYKFLRLCGKRENIKTVMVLDSNLSPTEYIGYVNSVISLTNLREDVDDILKRVDEGKYSISVGAAHTTYKDGKLYLQGEPRIFDTVSALDTFLANSANKAALVVGDRFYIKDVNSMDYYWDGTSKQVLKGTNLSNFITQDNMHEYVTDFTKYQRFITLNAENNAVVWNYTQSDKAKVTLNRDTSVLINNAYDGCIGEILVYGADLVLPTNSVKSVDFDYLVLDASHHWMYTFQYDEVADVYSWARTLVSNT